VDIALLGPLEVRVGQGTVLLNAPKERAVLEALALRAGSPVGAESLCTALWGDGAPSSASKVLQTYVSHLRRLLPPGCIVTSSGNYTLQVGLGSVDAARFGHAVHQAAEQRTAGELRAAALALREGLGLWRGRPCPELTEHSWASAEVVRLEELRRGAVEELADVRLGLGEHAGVVAGLEAAVAEEPLRERRWAQLILALYRSGRQADALRAFARLRKSLAEELGIDPSPELVALEQSVLDQSPELEYRPLPDGAPGAGRGPKRGLGALPRPANSFVGRDSEVAEVSKLVAERRLVTLAGAGGCGKTRLASEVAAAVASRLGGGAHFVALAPVTDPGLVPLAMAEALGVRPQSERALAQVMAEVVGHRETLVVVDNCEHVVGAVGELVEDLLQGAPGLRVLATSRDPLRIAGETVWRVPSLEVPEPGSTPADSRGCAAVELFVDRALAARPGLRLDEGAISAVAELTRRLDGMPLAIELAAARVAVLDLGSILERLGDRFAILAGGSRTAPARHQTLRAAVAWSYDLLSAREKDLFCRLAVFPGSFSLEAALALAGPEGSAEDLFGLVSKSMVAMAGPEGGPARYSLHETLRQFGYEQLDEAAGEQARAEHARYYLSLVHSAGAEPFGPVLGPWLKGVELEFHNLRAVFSHLVARPGGRHDLLGALVVLRRYWFHHNRRREGSWLLERAVAGPATDDDPVLRAKVLTTAASVASVLDADASTRYARAGGELAAHVGDKATAALAAAAAASVDGLAGRYNEAEGERALCLAREVGDPVLVCEGLIALALSFNFADPHARSRSQAVFEELLATAEGGGDAGYSIVAHSNLCLFGFFDGDPQAARPHVLLQIKLGEELGLGSSSADHRLGALLHFEGDYYGSLALQMKAFERARRQDGPLEMADAASAAAESVTALGSDDGAAARLFGFAGRELGTAGFGHRYRGNKWVDAAMGALRDRLGSLFPALVAEGAAMAREEVAELLTTLGQSAPAPGP
jgi:predicted ATPase/DNA-binding SARP family transcriptional activator